MRKGILFVLSGPSGAGKGTVLNKVFDSINDLEYSVSATTRRPRNGEEEGKDYFFVSDSQFDEMINKGEMLEHIQKYGNRYGTLKSYVTERLKQGKDIILEIETIGAEEINKTSQFEQVSIFLTPSSYSELNTRLNERNTETKDWQLKRLHLGKEELKCVYNYDYIVINDDLHTAVNDIISIITAERCKVDRNNNLIKKIIGGEHD